MKNIFALPFKVSPEQALRSFNQWAIDEQGLNYFINWQSIRVGAVYAPVWSFDVNVRFVRTDYAKGQRNCWKPEMFSVYGSEKSVIYLPGLAAYAGHSFRRSLIHPVHSTTLVFLGGDLVPFGRWMLRDMEVNGQPLSVMPDPWNATRGRAFAVLREELLGIAQASMKAENAKPEAVQLQTQVISSRRVYMPTFYVDYKVYGMEYRAFVSGCDAAAKVSGVSHKVFSLSNDEIRKASNSFLSGAFKGVRVVARDRNLMATAVIFLQFVASWVARILMRVPVIGILGGAFVGFRKIIQPWMDNRWATAEWERQREHEAIMDDTHHDDVDRTDFFDDGSAERFFWGNRARILRHLSGEVKHDHGDFDWYSDWEKWARQQWEQQQQQGQQQQTDQRQRVKYQQKSKPKYQWEFDQNDPYVTTPKVYFAVPLHIVACSR
jgi:hypothetical protein